MAMAMASLGFKWQWHHYTIKETMHLKHYKPAETRNKSLQPHIKNPECIF
jgi:hypothetical protein